MTNRPILIVWPEYPPRTGGMQVHGFQFARFLHKKEIPFAVITNSSSPDSPSSESLEFDAKNRFPPLRILRRGNLSQNLSTIRATVRALSPSAVFCSQVALAPALSGAGRVICRSAGNDILRPWIGPHDIAYKQMKGLEFDEQRMRIRENRKWALEASAHADLIVCNSQWTLEQLEKTRCIKAVSSHRWSRHSFVSAGQ